MKKLVIMIILLLNIFVFGEKFHSDGNTNLEKLKDTWDSRFWEIVKKKNEWYVEDLDPSIDIDTPLLQIKPYKNGALVIDYTNLGSDYVEGAVYFGWDTKYKTLVILDKNLNIESKEERYVACLHNGTCN